MARIKEMAEAALRADSLALRSLYQLRFGLSGYWSRRIDQEHRLVYKVENQSVLIARSRYHYE